MKKFVKKVAAVLLAATMAVGMVTGCSTSKDIKTTNGNKVLFTYDKEDVTLKEAWIYAKMSAAQYNAYYGMYYGSDFWSTPVGTDEKGNTKTFEQMVKEQVISQIKQLIVLNNKAEEYKISLSDKEKEECAKYAKAFAQSEEGAAILKECGAAEEDMVSIYEKNAIASKAQKEAVKDVDTNVSDDEARKTKISRIVYKTTKTDDDGHEEELSPAEKAVVKQTAEAALKKIQSGSKLEDVAKKAEYTNTSESYAAGQSEEGKDFEKKIAALKDGELLNEVVECDNGYVVAKLEAYTDREATDSNKETIVSERQQKAFQEAYEKWTKDLEKDWDYEKNVDQTLWDEVVLHSEASTATEAVEETTKAAEASTEAKK